MNSVLARTAIAAMVWLYSSLLVQAHELSGVVLDAGKLPVEGASVFFTNTSFGTVTDRQGNFLLEGIPAGKYDLVVSFVGYQTQVISIQLPGAISPLPILMVEKPKELDDVVVEPYEKQNWARWGKFFLEQFIGQSAYANDCHIRNTDKIYFRFYRRSNRLAVFCDEPLLIENKALGYVIKYQLDKFEYSFNKKTLLYLAYPLFTEMETKSSRKKARWQQRRLDCYYGSSMHFMRSVYRNTLAANGFEVHHMQKPDNIEKQRVKLLLKQAARAGNYGSIPTDSMDHYNAVMRQPDEKEIVDPQILTGDSIAFAADSVTAGMLFDNYLYIVYNKPESQEYAMQYYRSPLPQQLSTLVLLEPIPIEIMANGNYYPALNLLHSGYWAFSEKMASMLPNDYQAPGKR